MNYITDATQDHALNLNAVHPSWQNCIKTALSKMDNLYLKNLSNNTTWLPGAKNIFNAFSLPVEKTRFILIGESPYPRATSANGYAFWDAAVTDIWSASGLSKPVNRATSLRNIIKMLLLAENALTPGHLTQPDIAQLDKKDYVQTNAEFFGNFIKHGFLLLNATLVLQPDNVRKDANAWQPFIRHILDFIFKKNPTAQLILLGNIANTIDKLITLPTTQKLYAEHPYNCSFITNQTVIDFFQPLHLLRR